MIPVTLRDGSSVLLNVDLIEAVEDGPDTVVVLTSGRRMLVTDSPQQLVDAIQSCRAAVLAAVTTERPVDGTADADVIPLRPAGHDTDATTRGGVR